MAEEYQAVIQKIVPNGKHGPYAVAQSKELGAITISLDSDVWLEAEWPDPGTYVVLSKIRKKRAGWRAQHGRFLNPSDEKKQ
jgi:hypothetical protein